MPVPPSTESRGNLRRWLTILAPACVTMLVALVALWVLHGFLTVRDHLGTWQVTMRDAHGALVAQGHLTLVAEHWTMMKTDTPPYVLFVPSLAADAGSLTLTTAAPAQLAFFRDPNGTICRLTDPHCVPNLDMYSCSTPTRAGQLMIFIWKGGDSSMEVFHFTLAHPDPTLPLTATIQR